MNRATLRANPLTEEDIGAVLGRMGLLAPGDKPVCVPLEGGISSDIWLVEIGTQRFCLKRALAQLKVSQLWEAPIERNDAEWKWLTAADSIWPGSVPRLVGQDRDAGLFIMEYLDRRRVRYRRLFLCHPARTLPGRDRTRPYRSGAAARGAFECHARDQTCISPRRR